MSAVRAQVVALGLVLGLVLAAGVVQPAAAAETIVVTVFDDPAPDASCDDVGDCSLREAVLRANANPDVAWILQLAAGTYSLTVGAPGNDDAASGDLDVAADLTVQGAGADQTVIDVVVADRAFDGLGMPLTLAGLTVTGGGQVDQGGAVRAAGARFTATDVVLRGNQAETGGAVYGDGTHVTLTNTVVEGNGVIRDGGGVLVTGAGLPLGFASLTVEGGAVRSNSAGSAFQGGGIYAREAPVAVSGADIRANRAGRAAGMSVVGPTQELSLRDLMIAENLGTGSGGGGIEARDVERLRIQGLTAEANEGPGMVVGSVTDGVIASSHFVGNLGAGISTQPGPAMLRLERSLVEANADVGIAAFGPVEITSSTISGNTSRFTAGVSAHAPVTITASTIAGNRSTEEASANLRAGAAVTITGSVLAAPGGGSEADDLNCTLGNEGSFSGTGNVVDDASCPLPEGNLVDAEAALEPLRANGGPLPTHLPRADSAAIDAAGDTCPVTDARDAPRPVDGNQDGTVLCDAGAVEFTPRADLGLTLADGPDPVPAGEVLTYTASAFNSGPERAVAARLTVTLSPGLAVIGSDAPEATCTAEAATLICELGTMPAGTARTVRFSVRPPDAGQIRAEGAVSSLASDPTPENAAAVSTTTVGPAGSGGGGVVVVGEDGVIPTAIAVSQRRFPDPAGGGGRPTGVVLSRDDLFADSLGGSVLTAHAPLLFTATAALDPRTAGEIDRLLGGTGAVTLLGGESALGPAVAQALRDNGYTVTRLEGPSRVETALAVARAAVTAPAQVALARADAPPENPTAAWADAVTGGGHAAAARTPVLLTQTAALHPAVAAYLDEVAPGDVVLLGGEAALSPAVAEAVPGARRMAGATRYDTAVAIASRLWPQPVAGYLITSGDRADGWAYALAAVGLAADTDSPILLVGTATLPAETRTQTCSTGTLPPLTVIGGDSIVGPAVRAELGAAC